MGSQGSRDSRKQTAGRPHFYAILVAGLTVALALGILGCGQGEETTTTAVTGPSIQETTTTTMASAVDETTTTTEAVILSTTTTATPEETTTSSLPADTSTTEKLSTAETRLPDGHIKAMGFIKKVWEENGKRYISIDYAEMLTGQEAVDAAIAAGEIQPGEDLPNDYFIRNTNTEKRQFEVSGSVAITTATWHGEPDNPVTWAEFKSFWSVTPPDEEAGFLRDSPWWIERDGQTVVKIDEQYLP